VFKKELEVSLKAKKVDEAARRAALADVEALKTAARKLASRLDGGQPASGEAKTLLDQAGVLQATANSESLSAAARTAWTGVRRALEKVAQGFAMTLPPPSTAASQN
jgi:hypothetical protein